MKAISISNGVVSLEEFRDRPDRWLRRVAGTGEAVVLTRSGRAAGVLLSPGEFDRQASSIACAIASVSWSP